MTDEAFDKRARFDFRVDQSAVALDWSARGFSCDLWIDPPGQVWAGYVHDVDELVMVAEGDVEFEIGGEDLTQWQGVGSHVTLVQSISLIS